MSVDDERDALVGELVDADADGWPDSTERPAELVDQGDPAAPAGVELEDDAPGGVLALLRDPDERRAAVGWWARHVGVSALDVITYGPGWLVRHSSPAATGARVLLTKWAQWVTCTEPDIGYAHVLRDNVRRAAPVETEVPETWAEALTMLSKGKSADRVPTQRAAELYHHRRSRKLLTVWWLLVAAGLVLATDWWTTDWVPYRYLGGWWAGYALAGAVFALCWVVGVRHVEPDEDEAAGKPLTVLTDGVPVTHIRAAIEAILVHEGHDNPRIVETRDIATSGWWFRLHSRAEITDKHVEQIARSLQAGPKAVKLIASADDASSPWLRVLKRDPLSGFTPAPYHAPDSLDVLEPLAFAMSEEGGPTCEVFAHAHVLVTGRTRSGKSGLAADLVDVLSACANVELDYIDITESPDLRAAAGIYRAIGDTEPKARKILEDAVSLAKRRSHRIMTGIENAQPGDDPPQNHTPTKREKQRFVIIEEYPTFAAQCPHLVPLVETIARIGLKAAVGYIILTQSATKANGLGSTVLMNQTTVRICCSVPGSEIQYALGQGMKEEGYRPDFLQPAQKDNPRDAGKFYIISGSHTTPLLHRAYGIRAKEQIARSRERQAHRDGGADLDVIDVAALPPLLAELEVAFRESGSDRLPTRLILDHLAHADPHTFGDWDARRLSKELRALGMPGAQQLHALIVGGQSFVNPQGYRLDDLRRAMAMAEAVDDIPSEDQ